ncbi:hypothetical protein JCM19045_3901 [Bacillus sp. JCM 19045]|nr:hypothetical protein JCM19045_3901 [Bacillus sp. JCM 19045]
MKKTAILSSSLLSIALLAVACAGGNDDVSEEPDPVEPIEQLSVHGKEKLKFQYNRYQFLFTLTATKHH